MPLNCAEIYYNCSQKFPRNFTSSCINWRHFQWQFSIIIKIKLYYIPIICMFDLYRSRHKFYVLDMCGFECLAFVQSFFEAFHILLRWGNVLWYAVQCTWSMVYSKYKRYIYMYIYIERERDQIMSQKMDVERVVIKMERQTGSTVPLPFVGIIRYR